MSKISRKSREKSCQTLGHHQKYISRITKTLYYSKLPKPDSLSLPVTELAAELFSESQKGKSLDRLHCNDAAKISRNACVSPCSLVLALLYLEKLQKFNPDYLKKTAPSDLFLVSLMISCKFLYDDGETDEVFVDEWATSAGIAVKRLIQLEKEFLKAINWEVYVNDLMFWKKLSEVEFNVAQREGTVRGFFTYTELERLLNNIELLNFINSIVTVSVILAATYTAGLLTIIGSIFIVSHIPGNCIQIKESPNLPLALINNSVNIEKTDNNGNGALKLFKTGILLTSINICNRTNENVNDDNKQEMSWDWWTIPSMNWLSESCNFLENFEMPLIDYFNFLEISKNNLKYLELEDHIHKATKTRIQDQMEDSWHMEWIDTIKRWSFYEPYIYHFTRNIKP